MLETQVARLSAQQSKLNLRSSPLLSSAVPGPSPDPSTTEKKLSSSQNKASGKRQRSSGIREDGETTPSTPETFSKKSKKAVKSGFHPTEDLEDAECEPEGLPEVVKKGTHDEKMKVFVLFWKFTSKFTQKDWSLYFSGYCVTVAIDLQKQKSTVKLGRCILSILREGLGSNYSCLCYKRWWEIWKITNKNLFRIWYFWAAKSPNQRHPPSFPSISRVQPV